MKNIFIPVLAIILLTWLLVRALGELAGRKGAPERSRHWIDEYFFAKVVRSTLQEAGFSADSAHRAVLILKVLTGHQHWYRTEGMEKGAVFRVLENLFRDGEFQQLVGVNRYQDRLWFHKESFEMMRDWLLTAAAVDALREKENAPAELKSRYGLYSRMAKAEGASGYRVEVLLDAAKAN